MLSGIQAMKIPLLFGKKMKRRRTLCCLDKAESTPPRAPAFPPLDFGVASVIVTTVLQEGELL